jgi:hypothetical protein
MEIDEEQNDPLQPEGAEEIQPEKECPALMAVGEQVHHTNL